MIIGLYLAFGLSFFPTLLLYPLLFPYFLFLLRIRTFSDDSILLETGIGYNPLENYRLSLAASAGFIVLLVTLWFDKLPLYFCIIGLILGLICYLIPIFPDYIGKFFNCDVRTEKGKDFLWLIGMFFVHILFLFVLGFYAITVGSLQLLIVIMVLVFSLIWITWKLKKDFNLFSK